MRFSIDTDNEIKSSNVEKNVTSKTIMTNKTITIETKYIIYM